MKNALQRLLIFSAFLPLIACVETTAPICNSDNKINVPGLKPSYVASILMVGKDFSYAEPKMTFTNKGPGEYEVNSGGGPQTLSTCKVGAWTVGEVQTPHSTYQQTILSVGGEGALSVNHLIIDPSILIRSRVPFEVIERQETRSQAQWKSLLGIKNSGFKYSIILINNGDTFANDVIKKYAKPAAMFGTVLN